MDVTLNKGLYYRVMDKVDTLSEDVKTDLIQEMLSELANEQYSTDSDRVKGVLEAIELVLSD